MRVTTYSPASPRRLVVEPVEGASVRETLLELCAEEGADRIEARARGRVDGVRLLRGTAGAGPVDVITLTGSASPNEVSLALLGIDERGAWVGGPLLDARAVELSISVELLRAEARAPATQAPSWHDVAVASARVEAERHEADEPIVDPPRPGDTIEHPSFGTCRVDKLEEDEDFVVVRSSQGRLLRLSLEVLRPELLGERDGRRAFRSRPRGARGR
jgi:hypothetical protein